MKSWIVLAVLACVSLAIYTLWQDAQEHVKAANAQAWYRSQEQTANLHSVDLALRAFKDCLGTGEKVHNCVGELE